MIYSITGIDKAHEKMEEWLSDMLLNDEIRLKDIPHEMRVTASGLYVTAFRVSNAVSCKRFVQDLQVLCKDIYMLPHGDNRSALISELSSALSINDHEGEEELVFFEENIYESVLCDLHRYEGDVHKSIADAFNAYHERKENKDNEKDKTIWRKWRKIISRKSI